jgi:hypothetical protein
MVGKPALMRDARPGATVEIDRQTCLELRRYARARDVNVARLIQDLIHVVVAENLVDACLDDGTRVASRDQD